MKMIYFLFVILFMHFFMSNLYSKNSNLTEIEKTYIDQSQIFFEDNKIFVEIDNNIFQIKSIKQDESGLFFSKIVKNKEIIWNWACKYCKTKNSPFRIYCKNCGKRWSD
ncbi:MAG: hypothetical protein A3F40_04045 [Chlamydiae bacterium RIFCSPHIGHO2_12_FULL_27_8]|nr:MAG: hypothetical protein A3F40_04045 [Chlamydiae bacterium RIFCSPHIGHO2_12_FULL_27_8]